MLDHVLAKIGPNIESSSTNSYLIFLVFVLVSNVEPETSLKNYVSSHIHDFWSRPSPTDWLTDRRRPCNWCSFNLFSNTDNPTLSERLTKTKPHLTTPAFKLINLFYL